MLPCTAAAISAPILHRHLGKSLGVQDGKLVHSGLPVVAGTAPVSRNVAQRQPDQLRGGLVRGEVARVLMILRSRAFTLSIAFVV